MLDPQKEPSAPNPLRQFTFRQVARTWMISFLFWGAYAVLDGVAMYQRNVALGYRTSLLFELSTFVVASGFFALLTPFIYLGSVAYPLTKQTAYRYLPGYLAGALIFVCLHLFLRLQFNPTLTPQGHVKWLLFQREAMLRFRKVFLFNLFDDLFMVYVPVLIVAQAVVYHRTSKQNSIRASQLEKQLAQAELQALKMQLQPHFLFNTLNSISALMHLDVAAADKMMARLSDLLRMTLERTGRQETTLADEIEFLSVYLSIEQVRLRERLKTVLQIAGETREALVPYLLLQPIVENSIRHGVAKSEAGGTILVTSAHRDGRLHIEVSDNGAGFSTSIPGRGIGLKITQERLQALYGTDHYFQLRSTPGSGATVVIELPFRTQ
ncbi:MAG TPA: histidine kinase [Terriglobales bacterium]|nr:histidine kinase [Terriglobales bacterium]